MNFDFLFRAGRRARRPGSTGLFAGAMCWSRSLVALLLGLRHASDPDHLVAVTSLVAADDGDTRGAASLGVWWGLGHATSLLLSAFR